MSKREIESILNGNRGKPNNRRLPKELVEMILDLLKTKYAGFGLTLA